MYIELFDSSDNVCGTCDVTRPQDIRDSTHYPLLYCQLSFVTDLHLFSLVSPSFIMIRLGVLQLSILHGKLILIH